MFNRLFQLLYGSTSVEFQSSYELSESVERLRGATKRSAFSALGEQAAVGKVTAEGVRLQRVIPMVGNSFKPFFYGRFESRNGMTVLSGRFTLMPFTKIFMTFWLGAVFLFAIVFPIVGAGSSKGPHGLALAGPVLMLAAGIGFIALGRWFSRNDERWLSAVIESALGKSAETALPGYAADAAPDRARPALSLKVAAAILAFAGIAGLVATTTLPPAGIPSGMPKPWVQICAAFELLLAIGIWTRARWAWWGGFCLLAVGGISPFWSMYAMSGDAVPAFVKFVFGCLCLVVVAVWGKWWHAQGKYFA